MRLHAASLVALVLTTLAACEPPLVCREPDVWVTNAEGVPDGFCDIGFDRCEDGSTLLISCSNDTFSGDYDCSWSYFGAPASFRTGTFTSPDICRLDEAGMVEVIDGGVPLAVRVE